MKIEVELDHADELLNAVRRLREHLGDFNADILATEITAYDAVSEEVRSGRKQQARERA